MGSDVQVHTTNADSELVEDVQLLAMYIDPKIGGGKSDDNDEEDDN